MAMLGRGFSPSFNRVLHNHQLADEVFRHEVCLGAVEIREFVDTTDHRPDFLLLDVADDAAKIVPRALARAVKLQLLEIHCA